MPGRERDHARYDGLHPGSAWIVRKIANNGSAGIAKPLLETKECYEDYRRPSADTR